MFFKNNDSDLNLLTDSVSSHLIFCTDSFILSKQVVPKWQALGLKRPEDVSEIKKKYGHFLSGDSQKLNELGKQLAKIHYKNKMEEKFTTGNVREDW